jgi:hypothetical protein
MTKPINKDVALNRIGRSKYSHTDSYDGIPDCKYIVSNKPEMGPGRVVSAPQCEECGKVEMPGDVCCRQSNDMSTKFKNR